MSFTVIAAGPKSLPFLGVHPVSLLCKAERIICDPDISESLKQFVIRECGEEKKCLFVEDEHQALVQIKELSPSCKGEFLWIRSVENWGDLPKLPDCIDLLTDKLIRLEALPTLEAGSEFLYADGLIGHGILFKGAEPLHPPKSLLGKWYRQNWTLTGQRIVITRAQQQSAEMIATLTDKGAKVIHIPSIKVQPHPDHGSIVDAILGLNAYDWIVFSSPNGVDVFFELFFRRFKDMRDFGGARVAAVGKATAAKLEALHIQVDVIPSEQTGAGLAKAIDEVDALENRNILLVRPEKANDAIVKILEDKGAIVDDIPFYCTVSETPELMENEEFRKNGADWVTFCSPSAVKHFHTLYDLPQLVKKFPKMRLASIGPETTKALYNLNLAPHVEASPYSVPALIEAIEKNCDEKKPKE